MKLIVGLGNPGEKYADTRHNIGFMVLDKLANELNNAPVAWKKDDKWKALHVRVGEFVLVKPQTFMNESGVAVKKIADFFKISSADIWIINDDLDLPLGKLRIRIGGGSAGHQGVESVMRALGDDKFTRFRLGIGRGMEDKDKSTKKNFHRRHIIDFVLSKFKRGEAGDLKHMVKRSAEAVRLALFDGIDKAMNRFN